MYSGFEKIGEGYGSSLQMAETRAIKDALIKYYAVEVKSVTVPSDFEPEESITFLQEENK
jgi:large subunit ribosomal protein L44